MPEDPQAASEFALDHQPWQGKNANKGDANRPPREMEEVPHAPGGAENFGTQYCKVKKYTIPTLTC
jgi:hypothetical protein